MPAASQYGQIRFRDQAIMITPPLLRSVTLIDWFSALLSPLDGVMDADWVYIYDQYIKGHLTGQKMVMQAGLNFLFRITADPFIIVETVRDSGVGTTYIYNDVELFNTYMYNKTGDVGGPTYVINKSESVGGATTDFIVKIPTIYASPENLLKLASQVDIIKLTGKTYEIIIY